MGGRDFLKSLYSKCFLFLKIQVLRCLSATYKEKCECYSTSWEKTGDFFFINWFNGEGLERTIVSV